MKDGIEIAKMNLGQNGVVWDYKNEPVLDCPVCKQKMRKVFARDALDNDVVVFSGYGSCGCLPDLDREG